jgi:hypothetical protein
VIATQSERLRVGQGLLELAGEFVLSHGRGYPERVGDCPENWGQMAVRSRGCGTGAAPAPYGIYWCARLSAQAIVPTPNPIRIT